MRLSEQYRKAIKKHFQDIFGDGEVYLFGSRVDDTKKGGDIDLYLIINDHTSLFEKRLKFLARLKKEIGDQKIDIIFNEDDTRIVEQEARRWGVKL